MRYLKRVRWNAINVEHLLKEWLTFVDIYFKYSTALSGGGQEKKTFEKLILEEHFLLCVVKFKVIS